MHTKQWHNGSCANPLTSSLTPGPLPFWATSASSLEISQVNVIYQEISETKTCYGKHIVIVGVVAKEFFYVTMILKYNGDNNMVATYVEVTRVFKSNL